MLKYSCMFLSDMSKIFIGNLPDRARGVDIEDFLSRYGKLREISLKNGYGKSLYKYLLWRNYLATLQMFPKTLVLSPLAKFILRICGIRWHPRCRGCCSGYERRTSLWWACHNRNGQRYFFCYFLVLILIWVYFQIQNSILNIFP